MGKLGTIKAINSICENYLEGYEVVTDKTKIKVVIDCRQQCCEDAGYLTTNDDLEDFIGAKLYEVVLTDVSLKTKNALEIPKNAYYDEGDIIFINLKTSSGILQFCVYNAQNGYYGHQVKILVGNDILVDDYI